MAQGGPFPDRTASTGNRRTSREEQIAQPGLAADQRAALRRFEPKSHSVQRLLQPGLGGSISAQLLVVKRPDPCLAGLEKPLRVAQPSCFVAQFDPGERAPAPVARDRYAAQRCV